MYIYINAISGCLDLNISQQDECFCSKLGIQVEYAKSKSKNTTFSDFGDLPVASFCQISPPLGQISQKLEKCQNFRRAPKFAITKHLALDIMNFLLAGGGGQNDMFAPPPNIFIGGGGSRQDRRFCCCPCS